MIRYHLKEEELKNAIIEHNSTWLKRAEAKTDGFRDAQGYIKHNPIWGDIKAVFIKIQNNKCGYCERSLEGRREQDIEHFRPKKYVGEWPTPEIKEDRGIDYAFPTGGELKEGYYLLAYNFLNYLTACATCNRDYKLNFFPIAAERGPQSDDIQDFLKEKPYLINPLDNKDDNPEEIITFLGIIPMPVEQNGFNHQRARVIIDLFNLEGRENLRRERARIIAILYLALESKEEKFYKPIVETQMSDASIHSNCARSFYKLYKDDPNFAQEIGSLAVNYSQEYLIS